MASGSLARYAALNNFIELSRSLGLDPAGMIREVGLDPGSLSMQDRWIPAVAVAQLLELAAAASGREDFGLRLAELRRFSNLGPLSLVVREEPDVRGALALLIRYEHMYNEALHARVHEHNGIATLGIELDVHETGTRQSVELAVGVLHQLMQGFLGATWRPLTVAFTHGEPHRKTIHHRVLGPSVKFRQSYNGLSVYAADLDAPNAMSDPLLREYTRHFLDSLETSKQTTTSSRVRELVEMLLPTGQCSVEQVARSLGVDRRTVHRKLKQEGETFSGVLDATRRGLAEHMVLNRNRPLTDVAQMLAFSSHSNFTRWFRGQFGCSPTEWRRRST
ncbi:MULTISPECIES: AraC family transcriptional regulator [unclassified Pseudonocardia]|uniref:AraC family transcriptional regulator n=1 Tax=unclassified Pseudonocardia TaxID=2619320 RepID=UPI0001FFEF30|nr:AraC family transcriptional regulator [Pseudonocardia sp. Ae707_Ps1]OLM17348.1 Transcriptional regulator, AraC family [Pseudonocardia sp. Ae707_Ps1]